MDKTKKHLEEFSPGDTIKVSSMIKETDAKGVEKQRVQAFQGVCMKRHNAGISSTFTVRKISDGVGVERIYPLHSPVIAKVEVVNKGKVKRANLSYLKKLSGKAARIQRDETLTSDDTTEVK
ncbi:MAG: 50S ribosomal protein L19 [Pseudomonadota bacterium]